MNEKLYSVREIIASKLSRLCCDGLAAPDADCGCGIADLAPCGGSCLDCLPARSRVTSEGIGWFAVGFVKRPHEDEESNRELTGREALRSNELLGANNQQGEIQ